MRKADARAQKFKEELDRLAEEKRHLRSENVALTEKVFSREQEIARLHQSYKGGQNFDGIKKSHDNDRFEAEHSQMMNCLNRIGALLNFRMSSIESGDELISQVSRLQTANQDLMEDNRELDRMLQDLRQNQHNQADVGRMMSHDQDTQLRKIIKETEVRFAQVERENKQLRNELE